MLQSSFYSRAALLALTLAAPQFGNAKALYVSPQGSDSVSYSSNSESSPWATINHAIYNLNAGDTLYMRAGTYTLNYQLILRSDYASKAYGGSPTETMNAKSGTASAPVTVMSYPGEVATIDTINTGGKFIDVDGKNYWNFKNFRVINTMTAFFIGENDGANNLTFSNLELIANKGGDNEAPIKIYGGLSDYITITNNKIVGAGTSGVHLNTSCIFARQIKHLTIANNKLSNAPFAIYYKHATLPGTASDIDIKIDGNYITNTSRNAMQLNTNYAVVSNNVFGSSNAPVQINEANGTPGGDYNKIIHNTFWGAELDLSYQTQSGDALPGAIGNTIKDNVFHKTVRLHGGFSVDHKSLMDYNAFASGVSVKDRTLTYLVTDWLGKNGFDVHGAVGSVVYSGGAAPTSYEGFQLVSGSVGYRAASDGKDMGINLSGSTPEVNSPPVSPVLNVTPI